MMHMGDGRDGQGGQFIWDLEGRSAHTKYKSKAQSHPALQMLIPLWASVGSMEYIVDWWL